MNHFNLPAMTSSIDSDAETELGDEPLSPCLWTQATMMTEPQEAGVTRRTAVEPRRRELLLSPASQLDVLSQISELASAQPCRDERPIASRAKEHVHAWAPARSVTQKRGTAIQDSSSSKSNVSAPKRQKTTTQTKVKKKKKLTQAEQLAADILEWETCSENDLFAGESDDHWVYEDISDSDFESL